MKTITVLKSMAINGKWAEFWIEPNEDIGSVGSWDISSKQSYFWDAVADAGLYNYILSNGVKGLKLRWEKKGMYWEIDCFINNINMPVKEGKLKSDFTVPVNWNGKQVGWSNGEEMVITDKEAKREIMDLMNGHPMGISSRHFGQVENDKATIIGTKSMEIIRNKPNGEEAPEDDDIPN